VKEVDDMGEFPNEIIIEHTKQLATLRSEVNELQDKVSDMSQIKEAIIKLTILQEEQNKFSGEVSETLKEMNIEIKETKTEVKNTNDKVNKLESKFEKKIIEIDEKSKVDLLNLAVKATPWLISLGLGTYIIQIISK
jgi:DNA repair exonuclease SbcCD ATPase subunit